MATPTFTEAWDQMVLLCKYLETIHQLGSTVTDDLLAQEQTIYEGIKGSTIVTSGSLVALAQVRGVVGNALSAESIQSLLTPALQNIAYAIYGNSVTAAVGGGLGDAQSLIDLLVDHMRVVGALELILSRGIVTASPWTADATNTGVGLVHRLAKDKFGHAIDNTHVTTLRGECIADQNTGTHPGQEIFRFKDRNRAPSPLLRESGLYGSGAIKDISVKSADDSLLLNPSFGDFTGAAAAPTAISNWTVDNAIGNFVVDQVNTFRKSLSETTASALKITATDGISQKLSVRGTDLDADSAYWLQVMFNAQVNSADGNLTIRMGAYSAVTPVLGVVGWQPFLLPLDENSWPPNFTENDMDIKIEWSQSGGTGILVDEVVFVKMDTFDSLPMMITAGATDWLLEDGGTIATTQTSAAIVQRWFWRGYNRRLPSAVVATQVIATATRTLQFADVNPDTITAAGAAPGSFISDGYKAGMTLTITGTVSNNKTVTIASATALVITLIASDTLINEGPSAASATLNAVGTRTDPTITF